MARPRGPTQPARSIESLEQLPIPRERALMAARVSELRAARDLSWNELAIRAGINRQQVELIEAGTKDPSFSTIVKIATALDLGSLDELLGPSRLDILRDIVRGHGA